MQNIREILSDDEQELMIDPKNLKLKQEMFEKYPLLFKRLSKISQMTSSKGKILKSVKQFVVKLILFCENYLDSLPDRDEKDYHATSTEVQSECFPLFTIKRKRAQYEADKRGSAKDNEAWSDLCSKLFPEHAYLTPGLFLVTCCCPKKKVYGFKKMIHGESPRIIFDLIMTRFEESYNPTIIYDASCRIKEYGLNREPGRFTKLRFSTDPLHIENHSSCSESYQSTMYQDLKAQNKEACEQFNSILRSVQQTVTYMDFKNYMSALKVFIAFHNMQK